MISITGNFDWAEMPRISTFVTGRQVGKTRFAVQMAETAPNGYVFATFNHHARESIKREYRLKDVVSFGSGGSNWFPEDLDHVKYQIVGKNTREKVLIIDEPSWQIGLNLPELMSYFWKTIVLGTPNGTRPEDTNFNTGYDFIDVDAARLKPEQRDKLIKSLVAHGAIRLPRINPDGLYAAALWTLELGGDLYSYPASMELLRRYDVGAVTRAAYTAEIEGWFPEV